MNKKEKTWIMIAAVVIMGCIAAVSYYAGKLDSYFYNKSETVLSIECPPCPESPAIPASERCIYNDGAAYKVIKFTAKDGTPCYGIKRYGSTVIEAQWCDR
jgi:hypothetical protein